MMVVSVIALAACDAAAGRSDSVVSVRADSSRQDTAATSTDCVRGEPEPVLASGGSARASRFERTGKLSATEQLSLDDTTALGITHGGCAHYTETYAFTIRGATRDTTDSDYWRERGAALLRSLPAAEGRASQIEQLAKTLTDEAAKAAPYTYGEPLSIPELTTVSVSVTRNANGIVLEIVYDVAL